MPKWAYLLSAGGASLCLVLIVLHGLLPDEFVVDSISIGLVVVALIALMLPLLPDLAEHLIALRLPGVEAQFRRTTARAVERAEQLAVEAAPEREMQFFVVGDSSSIGAETDPNVRIAASAIELERKLREKVETTDIPLPRRNMNLRGMATALRERGVITSNQEALIRDVTSLRNQAVHGASVTTADASTFERVVGTLLASISGPA